MHEFDRAVLFVVELHYGTRFSHFGHVNMFTDLNNSMSAHKRIRNMAANSRPQGDNSSLHTSECSICLMSVAVSSHTHAQFGPQLPHYPPEYHYTAG